MRLICSATCRPRLVQAVMAMSAALLAAAPVRAQNYSVGTTTPTLGNIAAAASGTTTLTVTPAGAISVTGGSGGKVGTTSSQTVVTISCSGGQCGSDIPQVTITASGTPTGRAGTLSNFTAASGTGTVSSATSNGTSLTFMFSPVTRTTPLTFFLGYSLPVNGDNTAGATGAATSQFTVTVQRTTGNTAQGTGTIGGTVPLTVFRTLTASTSQNLSFGRVIRPSTGSGTAVIAPTGTSVTTTGTGAVALASPVPTPAIVSVSGEAGQMISVSTSSTFTMSNGASTATVTPNPSLSGSQTLPGTIGSAGSLTVNVGGSLALSSTMATGTYSGNFTVLFQYN